MLEWIRENKRWAQLVLIALIFPFACTGIEGYRRMQGDVNTLAKVDGQRIGRQEFDAAMREQLARLKQMYGDAIDPKLLDSQPARQAILDQLIAKEVITAQSHREGLAITDEQLRARIAADPGLQKDGKFDPELYQRFVAAQQMTEAQFESRVREDMRVQQLAFFPSSASIVPKATSAQVADMVAQERTVASMMFAPNAYLAKVAVTDQAAKTYYDANQAAFETPEQADVEYVVLNADAVAASIKISDDDLKQYYTQNVKRYSVPEQRRASHILIAVPTGASESVRQQARTKAESILAQVRKSPGEFAKLAKQYSDDPGSKERGGDLDFFERGNMVKPFDDAVFSMKQGDISDIVVTDFGFHIIQLTGIHPGETKTLDSVRAEIEADIRKQLAKKKVAESSDVFNNTVYEQSDSLKPVADQLGLTIKSAKGLARNGVVADPVLSNPKFLEALFSDDVARDKHNSKAIEVSPGTLVAGRVTAYRARALEPFEQVKAMAIEAVRAQEALKLAKDAGAAALTAWRDGKGTGEFSTAQKVSRDAPGGLAADALRAVFKANTTKLPSYVGVDLGPQGYGLFRIDAVNKGHALDSEERRKALAASLERAVGEAEMNASIESMRARTKVEVLQSNLNSAP